jgi:CxxC motif-containing protein (DUF1111 family)
MPHRHYTKQKFPGSGMAHRAPLALAVTLTALLAACGSGSDDPSAASRKASLAAEVTAEAPLTPVDIKASGEERGDLSPDKAIDHDDNSRWSSLAADDQYLTLDFGSSKTITRVHINWENAHATEYMLQVSDDNRNWTTIRTVTNSAGGVEDITDLNGQGQYLRMQGVKRSTNYGYSIFEIQAFTGTPVSTTPPEQTPDPLPPEVDLSKPGVVVKPKKAISASEENGGLSASNAIDDNLNSRWASRSQDGDGASIVFDFGAKTPIGYMKLVWENAYGKEYTIRTSDDGKNWTQLRYVSGGKGGTEEFFNLNAYAQYIQIQGVVRATQYGYSLFDVSFKTPGSDNTLSANNTSPLKYPTSGDGYTPLPAAATPMETIQFTLPDGRLVTRFGARAMARHGRERGEDWNEIGEGPNETVDPVTGLPVDKGPGNYLTFVPQYFQNRTWGIEIIDDSNVPGVTKPKLVYNQYNTVDFLSGGVAFFRAFDRTGVTGYGWMNPGQLADQNIKVCAPQAYPQPGKLVVATGVNNGCTLTISEYPGHGDIDANGMPNGKDVKARALVRGDSIEVAPSMFTTVESMASKGDNGGIRYYGPEWVYVVGKGLRPWYGIQPRLYSTPLPDETLTGGVGSTSYDYADNGLFVFQQPQTNTGMQNIQRFVEGRRLVHTNFTTGDHNEPGNDRNQALVGLQGGRFNQSACIGCHVNNGRSPAPSAVNQRLDTMAIRVAAINSDGVQVPHPMYGTEVQMNAAAKSGGLQNWGNGVALASFETRNVSLADGTAVELRKPVLAFEGGAPDAYSLRSAQPMIGTGLLEAIPEADILARVRTTPDADGVLGTAQFVFDPETGATRLGRFGWKASKSTLRHQAAEALLLDMGVTSPVYPNRACNNGPAACAAGGKQVGITDADLQSISNYLALLAVPAQRSLSSGFPKGVAPIDMLDVDPAKVSAGNKVFQGMRCTACHVADQKTGNGHLFAELRNQTIRPYSDLLLHDMGKGLSDKFAEGQAKGNMWRTSPLWGIGYAEKVMGTGGRVGYLHDGRARNLTEAIMWHGGEATTARTRFENLSKTDRDALMAFLRSL